MKKKIIKKNKAVKKVIKKVALTAKFKTKSSHKKMTSKIKKAIHKPTTTKSAAKKTTPKKNSSVKSHVKSKIIGSRAIKHKGSAITGPLNIKPYKIKKGELYMNKELLKHFEQVLNVWKKQLMQEVDRTIYDMKDVANYSDPIDRASQEEEFNLTLRERDRERKLAKKIDEALNRITGGGYGYCDECGSEIGIRRLEARPTATQCIECKTIAEIREKQIGS